MRSKRQNHASVVLLGQLFLLGGGWETMTTEVRTVMVMVVMMVMMMMMIKMMMMMIMISDGRAEWRNV